MKLTPEELTAVEALRYAAKHHTSMMVTHSKARTPVAKEAAQKALGEAARAMDLATVDLIDVLVGVVD